MSDKIRHIRQLSPESAGEAPGRGRLQGRKILVVGGGQRTFDAATDPVGNGRAMSLLFAREGAHVAAADVNRASADDTVQRILAEGGQAFSIEANIAREEDVNRRRGSQGVERHLCGQPDHRALSQNPGRRFRPPAGRSGQ